MEKYKVVYKSKEGLFMLYVGWFEGVEKATEKVKLSFSGCEVLSVVQLKSDY